MAGVPQIEVTFDIDANGIVKVSAKDLGTGRQQEITITSSSNMSEEEIQRAINEAKMYENMDDTKKEAMNVRYEAQQCIERSEQKLKNNKKEMNWSTKSQIKKDIAHLKKLVVKTKPETITTEQANEIKAAQEIVEEALAMYK